ncbi:uncharacterized protein LOC122082324 isoform X1 [Macadamia integrifolia]|uniref:uncharacterized protein LOC122082324 isoform X1 n=1 Tax=Macadamia integrifolia TaxID=60698 RepID=UPI001C4FCEAF|nr:uncharacterized protein LOC122082324 isoform X1 [Macadamia integrifolia]
MADESRVSRPLETGTSKDRGEGNELEEVETLEIQVKQTAQTIRHYRTTLPDQFKKTFAYVLAAQRPLLPNIGSTALPGIAGDGVTDGGEHIGSTKAALLPQEDPEIKEKIWSLNLKICSNVSAMPIILKRMNECVSMIDRLDSLNGTIHPVFKRKRIKLTKFT